MRERFFEAGAFDAFCRAFTEEMNRLRMTQRASVSSARREVARIGTRIKKLLNLMLDDEIAVDEGRVEMKALDGRRKELEAQLNAADEPPALLHPEHGPHLSARRSQNSPWRFSSPQAAWRQRRPCAVWWTPSC